MKCQFALEFDKIYCFLILFFLLCVWVKKTRFWYKTLSQATKRFVYLWLNGSSFATVYKRLKHKVGHRIFQDIRHTIPSVFLSYYRNSRGFPKRILSLFMKSLIHSNWYEWCWGCIFKVIVLFWVTIQNIFLFSFKGSQNYETKSWTDSN